MTAFNQSVIHVRSATTGGAGAGWLIAPDLVLTASHLVWSSMAACLQIPIQVSLDGTFLDAIETKVLGYNKITDIPKQNVVDNERDFALLQLAKPVIDRPLMGIQVDYPGGMVTISGFPDGAQTVSDMFNAHVSLAPGTDGDVHKAFVTPYPEVGFSGGPLWITDGAIARAVGIVSSHADASSGMACAMSLATVQQIEDWLAEINRSPAIARLYRTMFGRKPDEEGWTYWSELLVQYGRGGVFNDIVNDFLTSAEYVEIYADKTPTEIIQTVYQRALGRAPDDAGLAYWLDIATHNSMVWAMVGITQSAEATTYSSGVI